MNNNTNKFDGFIPSYFLLELARRNPSNLTFLQTLLDTQKLALGSTLPRAAVRRILKPIYGTEAEAVARKIYDAQHMRSLPGVKARFEGDKATGDRMIDDAYILHGAVRDFYREVVGRNSLDGKGMPLVGSVHYGKGFNNAFWRNPQMTYGDGDGLIFITFILASVVGHEMSHGVTEFTSALNYFGEPGALNEHFSDVVGVVVRQWMKRLTAKQDSWLVGPGMFAKGIKGRALRDMLNPGTAYDDPKLGKDQQPDRYSKRYQGWEDNGGVHLNSGIPNKAVALFAREAGRYSWQIPFQIWYATNCGDNRIQSNASFADFAKKTVENCLELGHESKKSLLIDAWRAVEVEAE